MALILKDFRPNDLPTCSTTFSPGIKLHNKLGLKAETPSELLSENCNPKEVRYSDLPLALSHMLEV